MIIYVAGKFQAFDYGTEKNLQVYGTPGPRQYSLSHVIVPVGAFWSVGDWINAPQVRRNNQVFIILFASCHVKCLTKIVIPVSNNLLSW